MKGLILFHCTILYVSIALGEGTIPPPPMPEYMKKQAAGMQPVKPPRKKLQAQEAGQNVPPPESTEKFLKDSADKTKVFQKGQTAQSGRKPNSNPEEVKEEFLKDVETEDVPEAAVKEIETLKDHPQEAAEPLVAESEAKDNKIVPTPEDDAVRKPTSFKAGMHTFSKECTFYTAPDRESAEDGSAKSGKKLWLDPHVEGWVKAYKKSGTVYIPADCVQ